MEKKTYPYRVSAKERTGNAVDVVTLVPTVGTVFEFKPGQFVMLKLYRDGKPWRQKAYSIASTPLERDHLQFGIKVQGEFTKAIDGLAVGDAVDVLGPYGVFTPTDAMTDIVFLAGGIGITPFLSILRYETERKSGRKLTLFYANRTKDDIAFYGDLVALAEQNPNLRILFAVDQGPKPEFPHSAEGRITVEVMKEYCPTFDGRHFFLCGPPPFMDAMLACLTEQGVPRERIKMEKFGEGREKPAG